MMIGMVMSVISRGCVMIIWFWKLKSSIMVSKRLKIEVGLICVVKFDIVILFLCVIKVCCVSVLVISGIMM